MRYIFDSVLPRRSSYIQGLGPGSKLISKAHQLIDQQRKDAEEWEKIAEKMNEDLIKQVAEFKAQHDAFV